MIEWNGIEVIFLANYNRMFDRKQFVNHFAARFFHGNGKRKRKSGGRGGLVFSGEEYRKRCVTTENSPLFNWKVDSLNCNNLRIALCVLIYLAKNVWQNHVLMWGTMMKPLKNRLSFHEHPNHNQPAIHPAKQPTVQPNNVIALNYKTFLWYGEFCDSLNLKNKKELNKALHIFWQTKDIKINNTFENSRLNRLFLKHAATYSIT